VAHNGYKGGIRTALRELAKLLRQPMRRAPPVAKERNLRPSIHVTMPTTPLNQPGKA